MKAFLRRTLVGGALTILVIGGISYLLWQAVAWIRAALEHVAVMLSIDSEYPALSAMAVVLLLVMGLGLLLQVRPVHNLIQAVMAWLGDRFPFSKLLHGFELELIGIGKSPVQPAVAVLDDHEALGFVMEELADGRCVVFVPESPNPSNGAVYILPREQVQRIDASHFQVASCISNWGAGMKKVLQRAGKSA